MNNFYLTTPIYYVNAKPHLGHAYSTLLADAVVRMHTLQQENAHFVTGTDEHGDKIVQAAEKQGKEPKGFVDGISAEFRALWDALGIKKHGFVRTTDADHMAFVQKILQKVYDNGDIYFGEFSGHYCYGCERFYTEKELENGLCPQHLTKPELISEKNYFFRMSKYLPWIRENLEQNPDFIRPERYRSEALAMLEGGVLEDLCISRPKTRLTWGIELPFDSNYVCYVWFDALLAYLSALGDKQAEYWPGEHLIAKDILKPHAIFWPAMLKSAGLPVYQHLNVHGYWLSRDTKMSKSLGNVVDPLEMAQQYGIDAFRYFLFREMHFGSDASFSVEAIEGRINADLANDLGNLFSRVLSMTAKYFGSVVPQPTQREEADDAIVECGVTAMRNFVQLFNNMQLSQALEALWELVRALNKYVDSQAPWALYKQGNMERLATVMYVLLASMRKIAICLWPVMPKCACELLRQLGQEANEDEAPVTQINDEIACFGGLYAGTKVAEQSILFPRIVREKAVAEKAKEPKQKVKSDSAPKGQEQTESAPSGKAIVEFDQFAGLDMRVGTVREASRHPNADRILCLNIDFGELGERQILSGIAEHYAPEDLVGKQVCAILNFKPRKIRGLMSNGMVLTAEHNGKLALLGPQSPVVEGSAIA